MADSHAQHVVVASLFAAGTIETIHDLADGHAPSVRVALGLTVVGVFLTAIADSAPQVAAGFAVLVLISTLFTSGLKALNAIGKALA